MSKRVLQAVVVAVVVTSCARPSDSGLASIDRKGITEFSARIAPTAFLLFDPLDCFTCGAQIGRWLDLRRHSPGQIKILVTRVPSAGEQKALAARRIPIDGVIRRNALRKDQPGGHVFVYRAGNLLASGPLDDQKVQSTLEQEFPR